MENPKSEIKSSQSSDGKALFHQFFRPNSIRSRLLLIFVLLVFLPTAIISIFSATANLRDGRNQVINQLESVASLKEDAIEDWVNTLHTDLNVELARESTQAPLLTMLQTSPGDSEYQAAQAAKIDDFNQMLDLTQSFEEVLLLDNKGEVILSTDADQEGKLFARHAFFEEGMESPYVQPPLYYVTYGKSVVMVAHPVKDGQGKSLGVLVGRANLERLSEIMLERSGLGETGETYLVGTNKSMLTRSRFATDVDYVRTEGTQAAIDNRANGSGVYDDYRDESIIGVYHWLPELEVAMIAEQDQAEAFQGVYRSIIGNVVVALASLGAAVGVGLVATNRIANPLASLTDTVAQFAEGEVEARAQIQSEDEIGTLASSFNRMAEQIGGLIDRVQTRSQELAERSRELEASQRVTFAASEHVSPNELLDLVVNLIRDQFGLYHAQVYIVDEEQNAAILRQSTGYAGRQLLQQHHQIGLDETALVTRAIHEGEPQLVDDTQADPDFMANPLLPDTRSELVVPLERDNQVIGVLDVQDRESERFSESTVNLFRSMADQVAMLFENAELLERITDQTERLTAFTTQLRTATQIARRLNTILDPDRLAQETVEMLQSRFGLYHAHIYLLDEEAGQLNMHIGSGEVGRVLREQGHAIDLSAEKSLVVRAALGRHTVTIDDTSLESDFMPNPLLPETRSEVAVPLIVGDDVLGVLDVQDNEPDRFSEADVDTLGILAGQIATAMQTATLFEQTQTRLRVSQALTEARTEDDILDVMIQQAALYPQAQVALMLVDEDADAFTTEIVRADAAKSGLPNLPTGTRFTQETLPALQYLSATEDFIVNNIETEERMDHESRGFIKQMGIHSGANIPIAIGDNWLGLLVVNARQANFFDEQKLNLYRTLVEQGASALQIARLNEATAESEQRLSLMVEQTPLAVIEWNTDFEVVSWNPAAQEIFGYTEDEAMGRHAAGLIVPEEARPHVNRVWQGLLEQTGGTRSTNANFTKDGRQIMCDWYNAPLIDPEGNVLGVTSLVSDITARVEAERQTRLFQSLAENAVDAFTMTDFDGKVTYANRSTYELLGYDYEQEELIGTPVRNLASEDERSRQAEASQHIMETGGSWSGGGGLAQKDGSTVDVSLTMFPILDEESNPISTAAVLRDITARKQAERAIRQERDFSDTAINSLPGIFYMYDTQGQLVRWNRNFPEVAGYSDDEMAQMGTTDFIAEPDRELVNSKMQQVFVEGESSVEANFLTSEGEIIPYYFTGIRTQVEGETYLIGVGIDIADRVQAERAMQRTRASVENAESAFFWFDDEANFTDVSDRTCEILGYAREQLLEMRVYDVDPVFPEEAWPGLREQVKETGSVTLESRHCTREGREFPVQITVSYLEFGGEDIYFSVAQDITERKQAEEAIRRSQESLARAQSTAHLGSWEWDMVNQETTWSDENYRVFGYKPGAFEPTFERFIETVHPDDRDMILQKLDNIQNGKITEDTYEYRIVLPDGSERWVEGHLEVLFGDDGQPSSLVGTNLDITERREAERAMQRTRASVENAESAFFWFDDEANFTDVSDRTCEILGYAREQLLEMRVYDVDPVFPEEAWPGLREQVKETGSVTLESRHCTREGREFPVQITVSYLEFGGEDIYFAVAQDITERIRAEQERERFTTRLETAAEISEQIGAILDPDELLETVIPLIKERFSLYYVHVYTLDEASGMLNLRAGYGEAGETMLAEGHAIPIGREASLVARAARTKAPVLVDDVTDNPNFMPNPLLPDTKTEVAVPAIAGGQVLGVFDVQHDEPNSFTESDLDVFLTLTGQIANAFQSASLLEEQQRTEAAMRQERDFSDTAINSLPGIFYMYNMQGELVRWNQNFPDVLGYSEDELVQMSVTDFIPEPDRELISSKMQQVFTEGETTVESAVLTKDGAVIPYYFTGIRAQVEGESYLVGVGIDITDRKRAEDQIRESEQRLSAAMRLADMAHWEFDVPTQTFLFNDHYYETFADATAEEVGGYEISAEEFAQRFVPPADAGLVGENIRKALETDDPDFHLQMESQNLTLQGEERWTSVWFRVEKDEEGNTIKLHGVNQDITERKMTEERIRESEQRLSLLVEQTPLAVIEWNTDFEVESWNPAAEEIFGYSEEEAKGQHAAGLMVPEEARPLVNQVWEDVLHRRGGTRSTNENFTKDGSTIICEWYNAPLVDQQGNTLGVASLVSDITARVEAEEAREQFTEQLRTAADLTEEISAILDPDRLLNRVVDELRSRFDLYHVHVYLADDDRSELMMQAGSGEVGQQMLAEGHTIPWDEAQSLVARAARTRKIVAISNTKKETGFLPNPLLPETRSEVAVPLVAGDEVLGVLDVQDSQVERFTASDLDIFSTLAGQIAIALQNADFVETLNETAERLREVDRLKSEFLASMSHELRTPLNSIIGYTEIMLMGIDQELSEETMEDVQAIYDSSQQLLAIINDVLDLARIEAGRLEMEMQRVEVADIVSAAQKSAEGLLVDDVVEFIVEAEEDLPTIWGDQRRIDQILNNLVSNAIKFTEEGHVALRAYAEDHRVCLAVEDTGVGIAEEDIDRIFERFEQLNQTVTKQRQGTGLGLAITRELVQLHGGTLEVESELGKGSTFTVRLPVNQNESSES